MSNPIESKKKNPGIWEDLRNFQFLNTGKAILCSFQNLIVYAILILLLIGFEQGSILLVDMYTEEDLFTLSLNVGLFHLLIYFLALIMSFYPFYIFISLFVMGSYSRKDREIKWKMKNGLILFEDVIPDDDNNGTASINPYDDGKKLISYKLEFLESNVRKFLGVALFIIWAGLLVRAYQRYQIHPNYHWWIYLIYGSMVIFFLYMFWWITVDLKRRLKNAGEKYKLYHSRINNIYNYQRPFFLFLIFAFIIILDKFGWSLMTIGFQVVICLFLALYLTLYRTTRKMLKDRMNEIDFINSIRILGLIVLLFIIGLNFSKDFAAMVNPINVILAGLIVIFTFFTFLIKLILFFRDNPKILFWKLSFSKTAFYLLFGLFTIFFLINLIKGNDLHKLQKVSKHSSVDIIEFYEAYTNDCQDSSKVPILYAAYGGGLKAHYWNYLILDTLYENGCFHDLLAMSGVSGGGMGIGNFSAMKYFSLDSVNRVEAIDNVKSANILSLELSYFLGADFVREYLPNWLYWGMDRSHRSMTFYNENLNNIAASASNDSNYVYRDLVNDISFDSTYTALFKESYYPNIIINSTASVDKSGIVSAIRTDSMFPGTINLLDYALDSTVSLSFFEAASTCNRFPFISPAAHIPSKGHFVDGGYYENSGVMSLISFKKGLEEIEKTIIDSTQISIFKNRTKLFSVRNDKANYLQSILYRLVDTFDLSIEMNKVDDHTEVGAVLSSIFNLERTPTYLREYLKKYYKDEFDFYFIDLPFYIELDELNDLLGGEINTKMKKALIEEINKSNDDIKRLLNDQDNSKYDLANLGIINPPTARLLSKPVESYMKAMMQHPNVLQQLKPFLVSHKHD